MVISLPLASVAFAWDDPGRPIVQVRKDPLANSILDRTLREKRYFTEIPRSHKETVLHLRLILPLLKVSGL